MGWFGHALTAIVVLSTVACGRVGFDAIGSVGSTDANEPGDDALASCLPPGVLVHLGFDEGSGVQAGDSSGKNNHGQLVGFASPTWVPGRIGSALEFDGVDDRVDAGSSVVVDDVRPLTICAWIKPRAFPNTFPAIADKSTDTFVGGWNFYLESNGTFGFLTNREKWATGGMITLDAWQHVCVTWDGTVGTTGIVLYQDGVVVVNAQTGSNGNQLDSDGGHQLLIGRVNNGTFPFKGVIDDFRLYGRVLDAEEIAAIHACGVPRAR